MLRAGIDPAEAARRALEGADHRRHPTASRETPEPVYLKLVSKRAYRLLLTALADGPRPVVEIEEMAGLPVREAWGCAADAIANVRCGDVQRLSVGGILDVLPLGPRRSRLPDIERAGIDPATPLEDLTDEERGALAESLITGRALRLAVIA